MARFDDNGDGKLDLEEFQRWSNTMSIGILPFYFAIAQIHGSKEKGWTERKSEWRGEKGKSWGECSCPPRKHHQDSDWGKEGVAGPQIFWLLVSADQGSLDICSAVDNKLLLAFLIWYGGNNLVELHCGASQTALSIKQRSELRIHQSTVSLALTKKPISEQITFWIPAIDFTVQTITRLLVNQLDLLFSTLHSFRYTNVCLLEIQQFGFV